MHVKKGLEAARIKYYNNEVAEHQGNAKRIFSVARKLMGDSDDPVLPSHTDLATLANRFSAFFRDKIQLIKANIVVDSSIPPPTEHKQHGLKGECSVFMKKIILWMKTIHYPNTLRSHLVTIVPMVTLKSTSKLRSVLAL